MTQEWSQLWKGVLPDAEQRWQEVLRRASGGPVDKLHDSVFCPVSAQAFAKAVREARELKGLGAACPHLWDNLVSILNDCVALAAPGASVQCKDQFSWRVVGVPKRCEAAVWPICQRSRSGVQSGAVTQFPAMPADQYCGAPGRTLQQPLHGLLL